MAAATTANLAAPVIEGEEAAGLFSVVQGAKARAF
jgi:hypothetical protein